MSRQPSLAESFSLSTTLKRMKRPLEDAVSSDDEGTFVPDDGGEGTAEDGSQDQDRGSAKDGNQGQGSSEDGKQGQDTAKDGSQDQDRGSAKDGKQGQGSSEDGRQGQGSAEDGTQGEGTAKDGSQDQDQGSDKDGNQGQGSAKDGKQGQGSANDGKQGQGSALLGSTVSSLLLESGLSGLSGSPASLCLDDGLTKLASSLSTGGTASGTYTGQLCRRCYGELNWNKVVAKSKQPKVWYCGTCNNVQTMTNRHLGDWLSAEGGLKDEELTVFFKRCDAEGRCSETGDLCWTKVQADPHPGSAPQQDH